MTELAAHRLVVPMRPRSPSPWSVVATGGILVLLLAWKLRSPSVVEA